MLIVSRTPLRVSFFGGGTDYPEYFREHGGAVLGMAIDKYIYIAALRLSGIQAYNFRLAYSRVEHQDQVAALEHQAVRAAFTHYDITTPLDISVMADMPASSGLGSSSTFSVGLLNLIAHLKNDNVTKMDLALRAMHLEHDLLQENVGVQDQLHASFGGINRFDFDARRYRITPMAMRGECLRHLMQSMVLVHTGISRHASQVVGEQLRYTRDGTIASQLRGMSALVDEASEVLLMENAEGMLSRLGAMLDEGWRLKRSISPGISTPAIDELYAKAKRLGALGGKLCGAGGGGFLLMLVQPERRAEFIAGIAPARVISIGLDTEGARIIYR